MAKRKASKIREKILEIQKNRCVYCGKIFSRYTKPTNHHRDHYQRNNHEDNVVVCCEKCHWKIHKVEMIFIDASDRLRQEITYSILRIAPPHLTRELVLEGTNIAILAGLEGAKTSMSDRLFKPSGGDL